jgi:hypothetical protein
MNFENIYEIEQYGLIGALEIINTNNPYLLGGLIALSLLQIIGGACLVICTGGLASKLGEFLICEGISDGIYTASAAYGGNLSLKDY